MAADNLERIAALVDRLGPLAGKARGMRIEAAELNALVEVLQGLLQVERAQEQTAQSQLEERFALKSHEHLGEVSLAWLDADLQARTGGSDSSLSTRSALADVSSRIASLNTEVARLSTLLDSQSKLLDRSQVDELDRSRKLAQFDERFASVENLRTLVSTLSNEVTGVKSNVTTVLELRQSLRDAAGNPIDVNKMRQELSEVQTLRENLKGVDGGLLRLRDVEIKLHDLSDAIGAGGPAGLDTRIAGVVATAEARLNAKVDERAAGLKADQEAALSASEERLRAQLTSGIDASRASLEQSLGQQSAAAEGRLSTQLDAKLAQSVGDAETRTLAATTSLVESKFALVPEQVRTATTAAVNDARNGLREELRVSLTEALEPKIATLDTRLTGRADAVDSKVAALEGSIPDIVGRQVTAAGQELETRLNSNLENRVEQARNRLKDELTVILRQSVVDDLSNLDTRIASTVDDRLSGLDARVDTAVTNATRNLPQDVSAEVGRQIAAADVAGQIRGASDALAQQLRDEQTQALAGAQAQNSAAVNSAVGLLRSEIAAARTESANALDSRLNAQGIALRKEFSTSIASLRGSLRPDVFSSVIVTPVVHQ
jgi:hypothetical protein